MSGSCLRIDFVSLFPQLIRAWWNESIPSRAVAKGLAEFRVTNPRDFTYDRNQKVDDTPYGGEPGMLLKAEPIALALEWMEYHEPDEGTAIIITDPAAPVFEQADAQELSQMNRIAFLCGHYEGIDHRIRETRCTHAFSIGDFVLSNGELAAAVMADAIVRLIPGVLGNEGSLDADSFSDGLLSAPNYTKPEIWRGYAVPPVLLSGNHKEIAKWRSKISREFTEQFRPDLLD